MSTFSSIKAKIVTIVDANAKVAEVHNYDKPTFDSSPAAIVVPSGNESDFITTAHNKRRYSFVVTLLVPYDPQGASSAESTLVDLVDDLIDDFDQDCTLGGEVLMMTAAPSAWGYQQREKLYRVATIALKCDAYFNVTT